MKKFLYVLGAVMLLLAACESDSGSDDGYEPGAGEPLASLENTEWIWTTRPVGGEITLKEFAVDNVDAAGVQRGTVNCYRPFDPVQQVYADWYYYNPASKTGEIEYLAGFYITPDNGKLVLPQYASYPHGAEFERVYPD
jgi:hypothetical protein